MLDSIFNRSVTQTATVQDKTQVFVNGVLGPITWVDGSSVDCMVWRGSISDTLVSAKFRADVSAVVVMRPSDISVSSIPDDSRLKIEDSDSNLIGYFSVITPDNIAEQSEVLMVPLKEYTEGTS
ncbi:hypothetical protein [Pseudoalteromonas sp.]|uniref:hypothetical protein n=1 Tax=Pseudoalteromonas sp. TaxID=53249 RepID=UPI00260DE68C|nr:hypothetical protein [Pseudoalteromonas sp.]MCP4585642.1 hypothetical protein [Pseudoalteromonas sp.]